jgi:Tfp pilus assembly protein PilO
VETKSREKILIITIGVCAGLWLLDVLLIEPISASWSARQTKIADMRQKIQDGKALIERAADIEKRWKTMRDNSLPNNLTYSESVLFNSFDMWGAASGVILVGQKPESKDSDDPEYSNMEWHTDVTGTRTQIAGFLYDVESSPLALKVESVELSSKDDTGRQLALGLTVSGLILNAPTNSAQQ